MKKREKIDVAGGQMTFGQRIELGQILSKSDLDEYEALLKVYKCLYKEDLDVHNMSGAELMDWADEFGEVCKGLLSWMEKEQTLLKNEPSEEERRAGSAQLARKVGEFGTIKALAKAYGQDPDTILEWKYAKVFGILYTDLEEYKYHVKLNKIQNESIKRKSRAK